MKRAEVSDAIASSDGLVGRVAAQESIRVDVNRVTVALSPRDAGGRLVDDLSKDDFEVVEESFANFQDPALVSRRGGRLRSGGQHHNQGINAQRYSKGQFR